MGNIRTALEYLKSILKMTNNGSDLSNQSEGDLHMAIQILEDELVLQRLRDQWESISDVPYREALAKKNKGGE